LTSIFRGQPRAEWCRRLEALDVPHAPMYATDEVPNDPQAKHLQLFVEAPHPDRAHAAPWRTVRSPVSFDGERALDVTAPPLLGDHDDALRSELSPWEPRDDGR
jgi:crotonobetainyl-CoA:carnitine CoA-transferase CaiB-like acyl-CoA transferase